MASDAGAQVATLVAIRYPSQVTATPQQLAQTLLARNRMILEQRNQTAVDLRGQLHRVVAEAAQDGLFERSWLIGSLQGGSFGPRSDVDVVCEGPAPDQLPALWRRFEMALGTSVDLLRIEELDPAFAEQVRDEGERLS